MPIYKENLDHIVGIFNAFDVLNVDDWNLGQSDLVREALFVPETMKVASLLQEFQKKKTHMAIVVDEYGGTAGLVTLEDILEEIVGEIEDEFDKTPTRIRTLKDGSIMVDGRFSLHDLNDYYDLDLPAGDEVDSIGGFLEHEMGRLPDEGDELSYSNVIFTVMKADEKRVVRVRMRYIEAEPAGDAGPETGQEDGDEPERH